jgi:hypothetical protein
MKKNLISILIIFISVAILSIPIIMSGTGNDYINPGLETTDAKKISSFSQDVIKQTQNNNIVALAKFFGNDVSESKIEEFIKIVTQYMSNESPKNVKLVGLNEKTLVGQHAKIIQASLQYQLKEKWILVTIRFYQKNNAMQIIGIDVAKLINSLENINNVNFYHLTILQFILLSVTVIIPIFILSALVLCIRTPNLSRKWLWSAFILFGWMGFHFDWTAQSFAISPIGLQLLGSGYFRASCYSPLILSFSIPIGAIVFFVNQYYRKHTLIKAS